MADDQVADQAYDEETGIFGPNTMRIKRPNRKSTGEETRKTSTNMIQHVVTFLKRGIPQNGKFNRKQDGTYFQTNPCVKQETVRTRTFLQLAEKSDVLIYSRNKR